MPELNIGLYEWPSSTELKNLEGMAFFSFFYKPQKKVKKRKGKKKKIHFGGKPLNDWLL